MSSIFEPRNAPGPLDENTDLYDFLLSAVFFDRNSETADQEARDQWEELFCVWRADEDITNGGFAQLMINGSGDGAEEAAYGLWRFGVPELANLLKETFAALGAGEVPDNVVDRIEWLASKFGPLDGSANAMRRIQPFLAPYNQRYYDIKREIDAEHDGQGYLWRLCRYIDAHRSVFFPN